MELNRTAAKRFVLCSGGTILARTLTSDRICEAAKFLQKSTLPLASFLRFWSDD